MLDAAIKLAEAGYRVHPLYEWTGERCACAKGDACDEKSRGKHPRVNAWQREASNDVKVVTAWWTRWPKAGIGLATGPGSGIWVLDLDTPEAVEWYAGMEDTHGVSTTPVIRTGRGAHVWWAWPQDRDLRNRQGVVPGVDVRANGGYVIAPPTLHRTGVRYDYAFDGDAPLAQAPEWLLTLVDPPRVKRAKITTPPSWPVSRHEAFRHVNWRLATDPGLREQVGIKLGGTVRHAAKPYVDDIPCPRCGRREVWFYLDEGMAFCHHANSCGWRGNLRDLWSAT